MAILVLAAVFSFVGCAEDPGGTHVDNRPPTVWLSSAPPEGNATKYRLQLFWGGWDPDGEIAYYEYAITDNEGGVFDPQDTTSTPDHNPWRRVVSNDSLFTFTADVLADSNTTDLVSRFERSHTFFIRAVDEQGLASVEPAYRSFTAWTLSPRISITVPRRSGLTPSLVPSIATYRWRAEDYVNSTQEIQDPEEVRYILHPVSNNDFTGGVEYVRTHPFSDEWSDWKDYSAPNDSGRFWTTPPTDLGTYVFAVQARDEAGAVTPVFDETFNIRRIRVSASSSGPALTVTNEYTGPIVTSIVNSPTVILDLPAGVPMQFTWEATAENYGGLVSGYRYGWDIADLSDPNQWEVDYTPFTSERIKSPSRTFFFGTHTFDVEVIDNNGARSRVEVKINYIQFTMGKSLLFVDDFEPTSTGIGPTRGAVPNDAEHDLFWQAMLDEVSDFAWEDDAITVKAGTPISIVKFSDYKSVIWDALAGFNVSDLARPKLYDMIRYRPKVAESNTGSAGKVQPNLLALFIKSGGHLMVCGLQPMTQVIRSGTSTVKYPFIFKYELGGDQDGNYSDQIQSGNAVGDQSFGYQDACINALDIAYGSGTKEWRTTNNNGCGVHLIRETSPKNEGMRAALPIDANFPKLELRPEVADIGKVYHESVKGLNTDMYNPPYFAFCNIANITPPRECFQPIYGNGCFNQSAAVYNAPVAFWSGTYRFVVPEQGGGIAARSVYFGFEPYYFKPFQVKDMMRVILFDEWQLPRL